MPGGAAAPGGGTVPGGAICVTCGTQYAGTAPPAACFICEDERQYVGWDGQQWTTLAELQRSHRVELREEAPGLLGIGVSPAVAIGQRALLVQTPGGNVLWDCIPLVDDAAVTRIRELGGIHTIAISHPHFYSGMVEWSRAFDAPILLHAADRQWIARPDPAIEVWDGDARALHDGITLVRCGGHFPGGTVLHWPAGSAGAGCLLVGDILMVTQDRAHVSFMRSYPNLIPLSPRVVGRIATALQPYRFDAIWSGWWSKAIFHDGRSAFQRSVDRYIRAVTSG